MDRLLQRPAVRDLLQRWGRVPVRNAVRDAIAQLRVVLQTGDPGYAEPDAMLTWLERQAADFLAAAMDDHIKPVFNLTGTGIHTNLGRASLAAPAIDAMTRVAGACSLEYDLEACAR